MEHNGAASINELLEDAALKGDVALLRELISQDPLLLHRRPSKTRPLHLASRLGHLAFTSELLRHNPSLAEELDPSTNSSCLHLASGNGHLDVVKALISANPSACLARDVHGMNPAHVAAVKGHVAVLQEVIRAVPAATRERGRGRESILHLCVEFNQLEAMRTVMATIPAGDAGMLLNAKDGDGNTVLHITMAQNRSQIMHFLLQDERVKKNLQNEYGWTPMDIFLENNRDSNPTLPSITTLKQANLLSSAEITKKKKQARQYGLTETQRSSLMVVASLVATMAFQSGLTPPLLQHKGIDFCYDEFTILNTIGLFSSMSSIILLISGLPGKRFFMVVVLVMMFVAVTCMTFVYGILLHAIKLTFYLEEDEDNRMLTDLCTTFAFGFYLWACVMALILVGHLTRWTVRFYKKCLRFLKNTE